MPDALLVSSTAGAADWEGPVIIKAQVPVGGRGKAGGIRLARTAAERDQAVADILNLSIKGHNVRAVRLEQPIDYVAEAYVSFTIDAATAKVQILLSPEGGVDIEDEAARAKLLITTSALDANDMRAQFRQLAEQLPSTMKNQMCDAGDRLVAAFFTLEAIMLEINPLFLTKNGGWMIGDAKLVADDNAFERNDLVKSRISAQPLLYPEAALKLDQGFDFVRLDPRGRVGLVTTGAGLSMQLVDELVARGAVPFNFCDIRTGMFRGDPARLIQVLRWISEGPDVEVVLINFFAGATDLAETTRLLLTALDHVQLRQPIVARLIGNNLDAALRVISEAGNPITVETDLDRAIAIAVNYLERKH